MKRGWKFFWKIIINCILGLPNVGVQGEFLVSTKFFQVACHFSMIFIKFYKIPWYFQVFQVYSHFSRFSRSSGNPESMRPPRPLPLDPLLSFFVKLRIKCWEMHQLLVNLSCVCRCWIISDTALALPKECCLLCHLTTRSNKYSRLIQFIEMNGIQFFEAK